MRRRPGQQGSGSRLMGGQAARGSLGQAGGDPEKQEVAEGAGYRLEQETGKSVTPHL